MPVKAKTEHTCNEDIKKSAKKKANLCTKKNCRSARITRQKNISKNKSNLNCGIALSKFLAHTIKHFFPKLSERLSELTDPRKQALVTYSTAEVVFGAVAMFMLKQGSRNQVNLGRADVQMRANFRALFGYRMPHMDTTNDLMSRLKPEEIEALKAALVRCLIEKKTLDRYRLNGLFLVGVDATGVSAALEKDEGTISKQSKNGVKSFTRQVLEAKLLGLNGFAISIATEWLSNEDLKGLTDKQKAASKQDSELAAFKRLAEKLKGYFPKLPICILGDGLYPNEPFFNICALNHWSYCVVLKDGSLSTLWRQVDKALLQAEASGEITDIIFVDDEGTIGKQKVSRVIEWLCGLIYKGKALNWIEVRERYENATSKHFVYVTNMDVNAQNVAQLAAAGRIRWKIEDAFNTQKNRGYTLHHKYSRKCFAATKNYYQMLQIGHLINQLVELSSAMEKFKTSAKTTLKYLWGLVLMALSFIQDAELLKASVVRLRYSFK